ncbi:hypothetical protein BYT27DRAFT_7193955 [Phlegmacium glaucopus]|nr:hypothetical protein BYT27DRAFT_7193955 [Phlegmacium glaucopus]
MALTGENLDLTLFLMKISAFQLILLLVIAGLEDFLSQPIASTSQNRLVWGRTALPYTNATIVVFNYGDHFSVH